jgi:hypothetical protein
MKYLKIAFGLALLAGLMAVAASPAVAAPVWLHCAKVGGTSGKWTNGTCTTAGSGEWETKELTETVEVTSSGTLTLEDRKESTAIECTGLDTGTVGAKGSDSVLTITNIKCKFVSGKVGSCTESDGTKANPANLPWSTQLAERTNAKSEKENRDVLTSLVSGKNPGWDVECTVGGVLKITDECTGVSSTNVRANRSVGSVVTEFEKESEKEPANCSVGGEKEGFVAGAITLSLRSLLGLSLLAFWPYPYNVA